MHHDAAAFDQIAMGDDLECSDRILLDQQDREPFVAVDAAEDLEDFRTRREPVRGWAHRASAISAGSSKRGRSPASAVRRRKGNPTPPTGVRAAGKIAVNPLLVAVHVVAAMQRGSRDQIFLGRQMFEHPAPFEHMRDPEPDASCGSGRRCSGRETAIRPAAPRRAPPSRPLIDSAWCFSRRIGAGNATIRLRHLDGDALDRKRDVIVDDLDIVERQHLAGPVRS